MFKAVAGWFNKKDREIAALRATVSTQTEISDEAFSLLGDARISLSNKDLRIQELESSVDSLNEALEVFSDIDAIPMQPITIEPDNVPKFVPNVLVQHLMSTSRMTLEQVLRLAGSSADKAQLLQLMGVSVSKFGKISHVSNATHIAARSKAKAVQARQASKAFELSQHREIREAAETIVSFERGGLAKGEIRAFHSGVGKGRSRMTDSGGNPSDVGLLLMEMEAPADDVYGKAERRLKELDEDGTISLATMQRRYLEPEASVSQPVAPCAVVERALEPVVMPASTRVEYVAPEVAPYCAPTREYSAPDRDYSSPSYSDSSSSSSSSSDSSSSSSSSD